MSSAQAGFRDLSLLDLVDKIIDNRGRSCPTEPQGFPLIATNCIRDEQVHPVFEKVRFISDETHKTWFRGHPEPDDVIFVCKGAPGRVARVPDPVPFAIAQDMVALRANPEVIDPTYLFYLLKSKETRSKINNLYIGTMIPHFKKGDFGLLRFNVHENVAEQRRIAGVLGALDDLIEVNRYLVASCRELRQTLAQSAMNEASDSRPLSDLARFVNGKNFTKNASGTGRPVIRTPELRRGPSEGTVYSNEVPDADYIATAGDTLFVWSGSLMVDRWLFEDGLVNQHIFKVIPRRAPDWYVHCAIERQMPWFLGLASDKATTMGHIQRAHLDAPVPVLSSSAMEKLSTLVEPLWDQELQSAVEVRELTNARDELLPLLMSGRVRVGDVAA